MTNAATKIEPEVAFQAAGRVTRVQGGLFTVVSGTAEYDARRATSCLIEPVKDDEVLLTIVPGRGAYVVAVLERQEASARLVVEGDLEVQAANGRVVVAAKEGVELVSTASVGITSDEVKVNARAADVVLEHLGVIGTAVQARVKSLKMVAETVDQAAERVVQRVKRVYRFVAEMEQVRAQRMDVQAEKTLSLHAENAVMTAEALVKVDGAQIHVG